MRTRRVPDWLPAPNLDRPNLDVLELLDGLDLFGEPMFVLARCSELTPAIVRDLARACRDQGKGAGVLMRRLSSRVGKLRRQARRRLADGSTSPPAPADTPERQAAAERDLAEARAVMERLRRERGQA